MKNNVPVVGLRPVKLLSLAIALAGFLPIAGSLEAQNQYFDTNGATAGSGVTAAGVYGWSVGTNWSTSSDGTVTTAGWTPGSDAVFAAGTDSAGLNYTSTLSAGTTVANSLTKNGGGSVTISGNTLSLTSGVVDVSNAAGGVSISSALTGTSGLTKNGAGILSFGTSAATYTGDTTVNGGTLRFLPGRTPAASRLVMNNSAIFQNFSGVNTVAGLSGASSSAAVENGYASSTAVLTISRASGDQSYAGIIRNGTGTLALTKSGAYTQRLSGNNSYTGATTVTAGTLLINGNSSAATGAVSVASGALLGGTGTLGGATVLAAGAGLTPGDGSLANLTFVNGLDISAVNGAGNLVFGLGTTIASDKITSGLLTIGSGVLGFNDFGFTAALGFGNGIYTLFSTSAISGTLDAGNLTGIIDGRNSTLSISGNDILVTVVPEPSAVALCLCAAALSGLFLRSKKKSAAVR